MKIITQINTNATPVFVNWAEQRLEVELQQIQLVETSSDRRQIVIKAVVTPESMEQIFEQQWFHYDDYVILHDINFNEQRPVSVTVVLSQAIASHFINAEDELEQVLFSLMDVEDKSFAALNNGEYWFLTNATQEIVLPPELAEQDGASLMQGFKTIWDNELLQQPLHERKLKLDDYSSMTLMEQVTECLELNSYTSERYSEDILKVTIADDQTWAQLVHVNEQERIVAFYAVLPYKLPDEAIHKLSYILLNENYNMNSGAFELDLEDGELRYRTSLFAPESVQQAAVARILSNHKEVMELYIPAIQKYIDNN